jgi:hypothetical protein
LDRHILKELAAVEALLERHVQPVLPSIPRVDDQHRRDRIAPHISGGLGKELIGECHTLVIDQHDM